LNFLRSATGGEQQDNKKKQDGLERHFGTTLLAGAIAYFEPSGW
jgi:hypothetical protein